jgi:hypothetical protein
MSLADIFNPDFLKETPIHMNLNPNIFNSDLFKRAPRQEYKRIPARMKRILKNSIRLGVKYMPKNGRFIMKCRAKRLSKKG